MLGGEPGPRADLAVLNAGAAIYAGGGAEDLAAGVQRTSRLSCQIALTGEMDGLEVRIPAESHNAQAY